VFSPPPFLFLFVGSEVSEKSVFFYSKYKIEEAGFFETSVYSTPKVQDMATQKIVKL
jgi:hypothetical protein